MKHLFFSLATILLWIGGYTQSPLNRPDDPIIVNGSLLPSYHGIAPDSLVAFKYESGNWIQIPLQIDERALLDIASGYGPLAGSAGLGGYSFSPPALSANNPKIYFYCDTATHIGADSNPSFDDDDELVFMAKDAGEKHTGNSFPNGTIPGSCNEITITNPQGGVAYVYIYKQNGSLVQNAGINYVSYTSNVSSVTGWPAHLNGSNAENTTITTPNYLWHISAEWTSDSLKLPLGNNVNILDRHRNFFFDGYCQRTENTFNSGENAYLTAKSGPIRIIRSVMGANSGPLTQRTHLFYEKRFDIITDLRVHSIPAVFDVFDYNPVASGMIYRNNLNATSSGTIDGSGNTDGLSTGGLLEWEHVTGNQGSLTILHRNQTNINTIPGDNTTFQAYYNDNATSPGNNCTGDGQAWGTSGWGAVFGMSGGPTTDPIGDANASNLRYLQASRIVYPAEANALGTTGTQLNTTYNLPLQLNISACNVSFDSLSAVISATEIACASGTSIITVTATGAAGPLTYGWQHDTLLTGNTATVTAGTYHVSVSDGVDTINLDITVQDGDTIDVSVTNDLIQLIANQANMAYEWIDCENGLTPTGQTTQNFSVPYNGSFQVIITSPKGCVDTSDCISTYPFSIKEHPLAQTVSIYPNPANDITHIAINNDDLTNFAYRITDITGKTISHKSITQAQTTIDLSGLPNGTYLIQIQKQEELVRTTRLIKN